MAEGPKPIVIVKPGARVEPDIGKSENENQIFDLRIVRIWLLAGYAQSQLANSRNSKLALRIAGK